MGVFTDLVGKVFGRVIVQSLAAKLPTNPNIRWNCLCICGNKFIVAGNSLKSGNTKSCGCLKKETKPGEKHGLSSSPLYQSWSSMLKRCLNPDHPRYADYGGRGIKVDSRWLDFESFYEDMKHTWFKGAQLDRKENNGNYTKNNCGWETRMEQAQNKRNTQYVATPDGLMARGAAAAKYGLSTRCLAHRASAGYSAEDMVKPSRG